MAQRGLNFLQNVLNDILNDVPLARRRDMWFYMTEFHHTVQATLQNA
jgi:hypothetical protein